MTQPPLSIIIISHNLENYIEKAVRSCDHPNVEIIVIDNASTDRTVPLIERIAAQISTPVNLTVLSENVGPGIARNIGMQKAHGEYITFLDGDDWYDGAGLHKVIQVISSKQPDVLLFNHARAWPNGKINKNINSYLFFEGDASSPEIRAPLMNNFSVAWNKAYRQTFIKAHNLKFYDGIYEDISWSLLSQVQARKFWVIPDVVINYRQRVGSILASTNNKHLNIFNECDRVFTFLKENPIERQQYGREVYKYIHGVLFNVLATGHRLPVSAKPAYMERASEHIIKWRAMLGITSRDIKLIALKTKSKTVAQLLSVAKKIWPSVKKLRRRAIDVLRKLKRLITISINSTVYRASSILPIKTNKVLVESYWGAKADGNPLALARALQETNNYEIIWSLKRNAQIPNNFNFRTVKHNSPAMMFHAARSKYLISNTNLPNEVRKRKGSIHVQTKHGTPLKVMGIDIRSYIPNEMRWNSLVKRSMRWDYVISSNPHSSEAWRSGFPFSYKIIETGYPRNDIFFNKSFDQIALKKQLGIPLDKKIALYAPTVRNDNKGSILDLSKTMLAPEELLQALGDDFVLLVRSHYFLKGAKINQSNIIDVSSYPVTNEICLLSDMLITDYSSIMFDYACLQRPIVLHIPDYEEYASSRGVYFDIRECAPGAISVNSNELNNILKTQAYNSLENQQKLQRFNKCFCLWDDGHATERVINEIFNI